MNGNGDGRAKTLSARCSPRIYSVREITISYEGRDEQIIVKPPNLSSRGMFVNTSRPFPEGAILNLRFQLALTGAEIRTRGEVRYCQAGVGVGVEFVGLAAEAVKLIEREVSLNDKRAFSPNSARALSSASPRGPRKARALRRRGRRRS